MRDALFLPLIFSHSPCLSCSKSAEAAELGVAADDNEDDGEEETEENGGGDCEMGEGSGGAANGGQ